MVDAQDCRDLQHLTSHVVLLEAFPPYPRIFSVRTYKCPIPIFQWNVRTPATTTAAIRPTTVGNARRQPYVLTSLDTRVDISSSSLVNALLYSFIYNSFLLGIPLPRHARMRE